MILHVFLTERNRFSPFFRFIFSRIEQIYFLAIFHLIHIDRQLFAQTIWKIEHMNRKNFIK